MSRPWGYAGAADNAIFAPVQEATRSGYLLEGPNDHLINIPFPSGAFITHHAVERRPDARHEGRLPGQLQ